jgi:diadenosine tetraphosphate (Ap4A) HIT family hydrolase/5-methylcytosine-specific restriction endonuclease McrA
MNFDELKQFLAKGMQMQHVYQPVMIKTLLESGNKAPVKEIAKSLLQMDESQIDYYRVVTNQMPGKVLRHHGVVSKKGNDYSLIINYLTEAERSELISLCETKIQNYIESRGGHRKIWLHRMKSPSYVPGTVRYEVLKRAKARCELCGIPASVKFLHVDHIRPRNKGGDTKIENFQALCYTCNSQKMDKDDTDFREWDTIYEVKEENCPFCNLESKIIARNNAAIAFGDKYPLTKYHTLVTPIRHVSSFFELGSYEYNACLLLINEVKRLIIRNDTSVAGFNIGINDGVDAGQTILHSHIHIIPRRNGDVANPRGGIRNIIPSKNKY